MSEDEEIDQDLVDQEAAEEDDDDDDDDDASDDESKPRKSWTRKRFSEKSLRKKLTSMLGRTAVMVECGLDDGSMNAKDLSKAIKDLADTCNKINGSPTAKIQMGEPVTAAPVARALSGKTEPQMNLEAELESIRNAGNSPTG